MPDSDVAKLMNYFKSADPYDSDYGHLPDTPENRKLISDLANDVNYYVGNDKWGNNWHIRNNEDGTQDWVRHQNMAINEGGRNTVPKPWNSKTGLYRNLWEDE